MFPLRWLSVLVLALAFVAGTSLWLQRQAATQLRAEIAQLREDSRDLAKLRAENQRLAAALPTATQLEAMRADHAAVVRLRGEIDALKAPVARPTAAALAPKVISPDGTPASAAALAPFLFPEKGWKNAGRATSGAAVETALWAATGGDLDTLTTTFVIEEGARPRAAAMFSLLPEAARAQYGTPEKLIAALFVAKDLPVSVQLGGVVSGAESTKLLLRVQTAGGAQQDANVALRPEADGWRVVVDEGAVRKYAAMLAGAAKTAGGK